MFGTVIPFLRQIRSCGKYFILILAMKVIYSWEIPIELLIIDLNFEQTYFNWGLYGEYELCSYSMEYTDLIRWISC